VKPTLIYALFFLQVIVFNSCAQTKPVAIPDKPSLSRFNDSFQLKKLIRGNYIYMNVDALDNVYLITAGNRLIKLDANGDSVAAFNDVKKYGNPSYLDLSNPLKPLLYYKNFFTIVALDRQLSKRNSINLREKNIFSANAISSSYDNNIWVFDEQDFKLKKISEAGNLLQESVDLRIVLDSVPSPDYITDHDKFVYIYDPKKGFFIFDYYGAYKNRLPFLNWEYPAFSNNIIYGFSDNNLFSYELNSLNLKQFKLPFSLKSYEAIKAVNGKLYLLKKDGLEIYNIKSEKLTR